MESRWFWREHGFQRSSHIFWQSQLTFQLKKIKKKNQEYEDYIFDEDDDGHSYQVVREVPVCVTLLDMITVISCIQYKAMLNVLESKGS